MKCIQGENSKAVHWTFVLILHAEMGTKPKKARR